jgi:hypothetical protein
MNMKWVTVTIGIWESKKDNPTNLALDNHHLYVNIYYRL